MAQGKLCDAKKHFYDAIKSNAQEVGAYHGLSMMLETQNDAAALIESLKKVNANHLTPLKKSFIEFAISNCFHKLKNYNLAAEHLKSANESKLLAFPSDARKIKQAIVDSLANFEPNKNTFIDPNCGKGRIFIVGMPRSGSTLLETILSMIPEVKGLGESRYLAQAITKEREQSSSDSNHSDINQLYSQLEPIDTRQYKYTVDKQLYNFFYLNQIATYMPKAKVIHCRRNPMDNILSMYRSNLTNGNNYTSKLEDSAEIFIAHDHALEIQKKRYSNKIFTFNYDKFVSAPKPILRSLLMWLSLEFKEEYLHPEKNTREINTASVIQARKPIQNKSVGSWRKYEHLLIPARNILQERQINIY